MADEIIQVESTTTVEGSQPAQDGSQQEPVALSHPDNPDTPTPSQTAPEGDPSLTRQEQQSHPFSDPVANPQAQPKVDAGDSGAAVGESPDLDAIRAHVGNSLSVEDGYLGYNPDPESNDSYTMPGVIAARGEV